MYFNVNFNVLFKLIKVHLLVSELYIGSCVEESKGRGGAYILHYVIHSVTHSLK